MPMVHSLPCLSTLRAPGLNTFDDPILILEILSRRFLLRGIYLITGSSKDGDGDTSFQWSQFTTQCSHLMFPSKDIMTTE
ncbi:hypothetical protein Tco_0817906 [Tanacetum coccineum]